MLANHQTTKWFSQEFRIISDFPFQWDYINGYANVHVNSKMLIFCNIMSILTQSRSSLMLGGYLQREAKKNIDLDVQFLTET